MLLPREDDDPTWTRFHPINAAALAALFGDGDVTVFHDRDRRPDDLGDLFLAFHEYALVIDADFSSLRLAVEHAEAGIHYVIEMQARTEFPSDESAVRVVVSGRMDAFEPRAGEDAEAYRARVEPLLQQPATIELARVSFDSFMARARNAIARAMPEARCEIVAPPAPLPPAAAGVVGPGRAQRPDDPGYDPHEAYYANPMLGMLGAAMLTSALVPSFLMPSVAAAPGAASDPGGHGSDGGDGDDEGGLFDLDW